MANETILLVEDSALNRKLVETVLRPYGYRLLVAKDGEEAISIAAAEHPDLILMDMGLPKMSGYEATKMLRARKETLHTPIIAVTAHAMDDERKRALEVGCDAYMTKPIDTRALPHKVREYLGE